MPVDLQAALQLWTVRDACRADPIGTLHRVADLGFDGVELVDTLMGGDRSGEASRAVLDDRGLAAVGYHALLETLETELDRLIDVTRTLGCRDLVCAWMDAPRRRDEAAYRQAGASLAGIAERCREAGVQLVYHHHDFEYARLDGHTGLEVLCAQVPADLMAVELDTYWVMAGGSDPIREIARYADRCSLLHCKDRMPESEVALAEPEPGVAHRTTELGTGVLDLPGVLRAVAEHGIRWCIVEQDLSRDDPFRSAEIGLANLRRVAAGLPDLGGRGTASP